MKKIIILFLFISSGALAQSSSSDWERMQQFNRIEKVEDQEKRFNEILKDKPANESKPTQYDMYRVQLAIGWLAKGNMERYRYYMQSDPKLSFVNLVDITYVLEYLVEDSRNLSIVKQVSGEIIEKMEKAGMNDEVSASRKQVLLEVNAMANAKLGNVSVAMKSIQESSAIKGARDDKYFRDSKANYLNRYAIVLDAAGEHKRALDTLTKAVRNADSNPKLLATFKAVYKKVHGTDKGADKYLKDLQQEAYRNCYHEVEPSYIADETAPISGAVKNYRGEMITVFDGKQVAKNVSLSDLKGKVVKFAELEGKIVVIDFWTTGCTPCVAAFAGFEKVVADYKKDPFQLYVINLFEPKQTVQSFITKKGITLDVLLDEENKSFNIQATPTKILFDHKGNIRFYGIGYAGSTDREYYKLKAMVEIIKARAADKVAAAKG